MTIHRQRGGGLPETTRRFLAGLPRHGDPVGAVWNRLGELERAGNDPTLIDALRAVLLPHQPPRYGRCPACPKRCWRRPRWPCAVWCRVHLALFSPWVGTGEHPTSRGVASVRGAGRE
ncbi:MAG TPA: hypothetical protein VJT72_16120 [Pseudonocardiaceae bacterium]|nr:hypothetical protein [Pseudonocardiaceae bacterium]